LAGLSLLASEHRACADFQTPTQTFTIAATQTDWGPGTASLINDPFQIQQFNAAQYSTAGHPAVLTEVVVSLAYEFQNTIRFKFVSPSTSTVTASGTMQLSASGPGGTFIQNLVAAPGFSTGKTLTFGTGPGDYTQNVYVQPTPKVIASTSATGYKDATTLAMFTGTGTITAPLTATATSNFANTTGNGNGGSTTLASAVLSVTYFFQVVPEPSSLVLTGLGAVGLLAVSRVRTRRGDAAAA
jgi:hypothetical protein